LQDNQSLAGLPKGGSTSTQSKPSVEIEEHAEVCSTSDNAVPGFVFLVLMVSPIIHCIHIFSQGQVHMMQLLNFGHAQ